MKIFRLILFSLFVVSCSSKEESISSINLPDNMYLLSGNYRAKYDGINSDIKMVAYYDSTACSNCAIKNSYEWSSLINLMEKHNEKASVVLIFAPKPSQFSTVMKMLDEYMVDYPVYIDTAYSVKTENPSIPPLFYGLVDKEQKVLLSGNPFVNNKILTKYINTINSLLY